MTHESKALGLRISDLNESAVVVDDHAEAVNLEVVCQLGDLEVSGVTTVVEVNVVRNVVSVLGVLRTLCVKRQGNSTGKTLRSSEGAYASLCVFGLDSVVDIVDTKLDFVSHSFLLRKKKAASSGWLIDLSRLMRRYLGIANVNSAKTISSPGNKSIERL